MRVAFSTDEQVASGIQKGGSQERSCATGHLPARVSRQTLLDKPAVAPGGGGIPDCTPFHPGDMVRASRGYVKPRDCAILFAV